MSGRYGERTRRPAKTLTDAERDRLLQVSAEHRQGFRDHLIFSFALGTGLRESEILALDVCDVSRDGLRPKQVIQLRVFKRAGADPDLDEQRVHLPESTYYKLEKYLSVRRPSCMHNLQGPLFLSREGSLQRLASRTLRDNWYRWQERAGFDHRYNFHILRHTAITTVSRAKGVRIAMSFARHRNLQTTRRYDHPSQEELAQAVKELPA